MVGGEEQNLSNKCRVQNQSVSDALLLVIQFELLLSGHPRKQGNCLSPQFFAKSDVLCTLTKALKKMSKKRKLFSEYQRNSKQVKVDLDTWNFKKIFKSCYQKT